MQVNLNADLGITWKGWYEQHGSKHNMSFKDFQIDDEGIIAGEGNDEVGDFSIKGEIQDDGALKFTKTYIGKHSIVYTGQFDDDFIKGKWVIDKPNFNANGNFELEQIAPTWKGTYNYKGDDIPFELKLKVFGIKIAGIGEDNVGNFTITGTLQGNSMKFTKQYLGQHFVNYEGSVTRSGQAVAVNGQWSIPGNSSGSFTLHTDGVVI